MPDEYQTDLEARISLARDDVREYIMLMISAVDGDTVAEHEMFDLYVDSIVASLAEPKHCLIIAPPEHMKTTVLRWALVWLKGKNPRLRFGLSSADLGRSKKTLTAIRKGITSSINRLIFPHMQPDMSRSAARGEWSQMALYLDGDVTDPSFEVYAFWGEALGGRVDIWMLDDHVSPDCETSPTIREDTWRRLNGTFLNRLTDDGIAFMLGNVWHREDPNHKMAQSPSVHTLWIGYNSTDELYWRCMHPARGWKHGEAGTMPRWEAVWPERRLIAKYNTDPGTYRKTFGGRALSEEDMVFPPHGKWKRYRPEEIASIKDQIRIYARLDPAGGKMLKKSDFCSISAVGIDKNRIMYLLAWRCFKASPLLQARALWDMHDWFKREGYLQGIYMAEVEMMPNDDGWIWPLIESINAEEQARGNGLDVRASYSNIPKPSRIHSMLKHFVHGFIRFPYDWESEMKASGETREITSQIEEYRGEMTKEHDDAPDSLQGAIKLAEREGPYIPRQITDLQSDRMVAQYAKELAVENVMRKRGPDGKMLPPRRGLSLGRIG